MCHDGVLDRVKKCRMVQLKTEMIKRIEVQHDKLCDEFEDLVFLLLGSDDVNLQLNFSFV